MRLGETQSILLPKGTLASDWLLRAWTTKALKPSRDGGSTTTQGELSGLFMGKVSPYTHPEPLSFQLQEIASCLPVLHHWEKSHSISSMTLWWYPKAVSFPSWPRPASPVSPHGASAPALLPWELSLELPPVCACLSSAGSQNWTQYLHVVWSATQKGDNPSPWPLSHTPGHSSEAARCLCCQSSPQWCWADCPLWPQGCTAELLPSPILWQCHCRGSSFPGAKKVSASRKNASEPFGYIVLTTSVNKEWRCFYHI